MSSNATLVLTSVKVASALLGLIRELGISYEELSQVMEKAEKEGREVTVEDLQGLVDSSKEARTSLRDAISRARDEQ